MPGLSGKSSALIFAALSVHLGCVASSPPRAVDRASEASAEPPAPLAVRAPFFIPGEQMAWELSLHGVVGGEAVLAVGNPGRIDGKEVVILRSQVESTGVAKLIKEVSDDVTTWVDLTTAHPVYYYADVRFGKKQGVIETTFSPDKLRILYKRPGHPTRTYIQKLPPGLLGYDTHAVLGALRAWAASSDQRAYFYVLSGKRLWKATIAKAGTEAISTALGEFRAIRIDGTAHRLERNLTPDPAKEARAFSLWISDDARRVPLLVTARTEYGDVAAALIHYHRPSARVSSR
ncbi:MAG TPA: DUF3108 domain-containing protein [Kofleriaceae bacterium]|nr:DUF3108 domain-containing protein [Kofleriaceae bacterium]